jgi:thiol-disulfide isomerase/thioredoxin
LCVAVDLLLCSSTFAHVFQCHRFAAAGDRLVVMYFTASWCGPCRTVGPKVEEMSGRTPEAVFLKIDIDACPVRLQSSLPPSSARSPRPPILPRLHLRLASLCTAAFTQELTVDCYPPTVTIAHLVLCPSADAHALRTCMLSRFNAFRFFWNENVCGSAPWPFPRTSAESSALQQCRHLCCSRTSRRLARCRGPVTHSMAGALRCMLVHSP